MTTIQSDIAKYHEPNISGTVNLQMQATALTYLVCKYILHRMLASFVALLVIENTSSLSYAMDTISCPAFKYHMATKTFS